LRYINYNDKHPRFKQLCESCAEYGISKTKTQTLNEGENNLTIIAEDSYGNIIEKNISLFIDSKQPKVIQTLPKKNSITNGSEFFIKYTEDNLQSIILYLSPNDNITFQNCPSGKNVNCSQTVDLVKFDSKIIDFYFELSDSINFVKSKLTKISVDTTPPVITVNSPISTDYGKTRIIFNITITEPVKLEYEDLSDSNPKFKKLCVKCTDYGNSRQKIINFKQGRHDILITAVDSAGNADSKEIILDIK